MLNVIIQRFLSIIYKIIENLSDQLLIDNSRGGQRVSVSRSDSDLVSKRMNNMCCFSCLCLNGEWTNAPIMHRKGGGGIERAYVFRACCDWNEKQCFVIFRHVQQQNYHKESNKTFFRSVWTSAPTGMHRMVVKLFETA